MLLNHILLAFFWIVYVFLHSFLITPRTKDQVRKAMGNQFQRYRLYYNLFSFFTLAALLWFQISIPTVRLFSPSVALSLAGILIAGLGLVIMIRCIYKYFFSLSGLRTLVREDGDEAGPLMVSGIHRYVRHPLYLGTFLFIWGLFLVIPYLSLLLSNTIITVYTLIGIQLEERKLVTTFGEDYRMYQRQVPKILPRLHRRNAGSTE